MNNNQPTQPAAGFTVGDLYYVVFRHKWKIVLLTLVGLMAALALYFLKAPPYQSQAELLIQYVPTVSAPTLAGSDQNVIVPHDIINSEILILTSLDLAEQAANNFGPGRLMGGAGDGSNNVFAAAGLIQSHLKAVPAGDASSVIAVTFEHPDAQIVQPLLQEIINDYFQKHKEIHSTEGQFDDALREERADLSMQLNDTEQQLATLKNNAKIISLDDERKALADQISKVQGARLDAWTELAGYEAVTRQTSNTTANVLAITNSPMVVPPEQLQAYNDIKDRLDMLRTKRHTFLAQGFTSSNLLVQDVDGEISEAQKIKTGLEEKYPQIVSQGSASPGSDSQSHASQIALLQARLRVFDEQLDDLQTQITNLNSLAPTIARLEQTKAIQQANYLNLATKLENSHIDQALDTGKTPNIKWVQQPSPPFRDWRKTRKAMAMSALGGLFAGLAWAFLIEFYLDRSIRRPVDVQTWLKMPFLLSIPDLNHNRHSQRAAMQRQLEYGDQKSLATTSNGAIEITSPLVNHALHSYYDALRDRLTNYFESINLTRKPKLVAVAGTMKGSGVSTIAAGLAASISETGDGRVLLVDMNVKDGAAQQFINGQPGCQLDDALIGEKRESAMVQENLYVVSEASNVDRLPRMLPKRFASLVPKLKASDYDYIIFDMPPVTQTSLTTRLAGFMDMVMLVIESEKTDRDVVQQANQLLLQSKANVTVVLNKTRKYVPARLQSELNGDV